MTGSDNKRIKDSRNDFTKGSVAGNIMSLAVPMTVAQLINVLYSVIDRIYIGHLSENATLALTGLGLTFPILMLITAFANLIGMGGAPLCSIERGRGNDEEAERITGCSFSLLVLFGVVLMAVFFCFKREILFLFGASGDTFPYADDYLTLYLMGTLFVMLGLGMNSFINAQGFAKFGMATVLIGAVLNIVLDPIFIFALDMGIKGAAVATVISQFVSAAWVMRFLTGRRAIYRIKKKYLFPGWRLTKQIIYLGLSGFIFSVTNSLVQIVCNITLFAWGGDLYVGVMTVLNSIRMVLQMPIDGIRSGAQPVLGFNYGAKSYERVREGIGFLTKISLGYTVLAWLVLMIFPHGFIHLFNSEPEMLEAGVPAMSIYFFGFFMMAFQSAGQTTFVSLGKGGYATFFSLFRKAILVVPLTIILPHVGNLGVDGVFYAELISNFVGGGTCYATMMLTVWRRLKN